jgi:hypothetical protein
MIRLVVDSRMRAPIEPMTDPWTERVTITKLDAARRQLQTAIELWFADGEPVSIHALAFAAYEIVHVISKKRNRSIPLIFDARIIKDEYRKEWNNHIKKSSVFFKHADRDPNDSIDFQPALSEFFISFAIVGLELCGEKLTDVESAFMFWLQLHHPNLLNEEGRLFIGRIPINVLEESRNIPRHIFLDAFLQGRKSANRS